MRSRRAGPPAALTILLLLGGCRAPERYPFEPRHETQVQVLSGVSDDGEPGVSSRPSIGLGVVVSEPRSGGWNYEGGWRYGEEDGKHQGLTRELEYQELLVGLRQVYRREQRLQPYVGFGGAYRTVVRRVTQPDFSGVDEGLDDTDERGFGVYARTGLQYVPGEDRLGARRGFVIGVDVRGTLSGPYDSIEAALALGFRW